jgi:hypothetical protein
VFFQINHHSCRYATPLIARLSLPEPSILFSELLCSASTAVSLQKFLNHLLNLEVHIYLLSYPCLYIKSDFSLPSLLNKLVMALTIIPARHSLAIPLKAGETLKIINTYGTQVIDTWAFTVSSSKITSLNKVSLYMYKLLYTMLTLR